MFWEGLEWFHEVSRRILKKISEGPAGGESGWARVHGRREIFSTLMSSLKGGMNVEVGKKDRRRMSRNAVRAGAVVDIKQKRLERRYMEIHEHLPKPVKILEHTKAKQSIRKQKQLPCDGSNGRC